MAQVGVRSARSHPNRLRVLTKEKEDQHGTHRESSGSRSVRDAGESKDVPPGAATALCRPAYHHAFGGCFLLATVPVN
jgi:hypothetical protein